MRCCNEARGAGLTDSELQDGLIVANYGRHFLVEAPSGQRVICHSRGKKSEGVVGDAVRWKASRDEGTIESIAPRENILYRRDEVRTKSFAANLDRVLILIAAEPPFSSSQLSRALIAAEAQGINPLIALNKSDLVEPFARAWEMLLPYRNMGYDMLGLSLVSHPDRDRAALLALLQGQTTLVLGPSGAGKSTLINLLAHDAAAETGPLSKALRAGKHTTTSTTLYWIDDAKSAALIDSPGFQEFGLQHIDPMHLAPYMPDLKAHAAHCRFYNCTHLHEPECAVIAAVDADTAPGAISPDRYRIYRELFTELSRSRH
ncbi:MAG: ribosome small subunit-dependent GTPase A [Burkholderiaceae bacterium]